METAVRFIKDNFTRVALLKEGGNGSTELVLGADKQVYVRKIIPYTNLPYGKLAALEHPVLPQLYYVAEDGASTYVIEEYIEGTNLQDWLEQKGFLPEEKVRRIGLQLCGALEVLHAQGILHRDIKPANIIYKRDGSVRLIDFGAARTYAKSGAEEAPHDTNILGTQGYAPPEQYGFASTDGRSDLYALGRTLKVLLGPGYHGTLRKILRRCTQLDPERRVQSATALQKLLARQPWRNFKIGAAAALAVLIFVAGGTWAWQVERGNKGWPFFDFKVTSETAKPDSQPGAASSPGTATGNLPAKEAGISSPPEAKNKKGSTGNQAEATAPGAELKTNASRDQTGSTWLEEGSSLKEEAAQNQDSDQAAGAQRGTQTGTQGTNDADAAGETIAEAAVSSGSWNFTRVPPGDDRPMLALMQKQAAAQGYTLVDASSGDWPVVEVTNTTGVPLENPRVELYFNDFGVMGRGLDIASDINERESLNLHTSGSQSLTDRATIQLNGRVAPGETRQFGLSGGVDSFYQTGGSPSVRVVFSADNAEAVEKSYDIKVR